VTTADAAHDVGREALAEAGMQSAAAARAADHARALLARAVGARRRRRLAQTAANVGRTILNGVVWKKRKKKKKKKKKIIFAGFLSFLPIGVIHKGP
jgi:hypothetical protein